ncbi:hypothetical protein K3495_g3458 [Podosphaera aphanis]|nr:hypothetical protein K3495_g3458 [Podosphaera aphanis]
MPAIKRLAAPLQVENGAAKSKTMIDSAETPRLAFIPAEKTANQPTSQPERQSLAPTSIKTLQTNSTELVGIQ